MLWIRCPFTLYGRRIPSIRHRDPTVCSCLRSLVRLPLLILRLSIPGILLFHLPPSNLLPSPPGRISNSKPPTPILLSIKTPSTSSQFSVVTATIPSLSHSHPTSIYHISINYCPWSISSVPNFSSPTSDSRPLSLPNTQSSTPLHLFPRPVSRAGPQTLTSLTKSQNLNHLSIFSLP